MTWKQNIAANAQWIFSGIGVAAILMIAGALRHFFSSKAKHQDAKPREDIIQQINSGLGSTNIQAGHSSTILIGKEMATHDTHSTKVNPENPARHKVKISEGDYHEFVWDGGLLRVSVSQIVKSSFYNSSIMAEIESLGATIDFSGGGSIFYGGNDCKRKGVNQFLIPQKKFSDEETVSVYRYQVHDRSFNFFRAFIDHVNEPNRQVTLDLFFLAIRR